MVREQNQLDHVDLTYPPRWLWAPFVFVATVLALAWYYAPSPIKVEPRGRWVSARDTLLIGAPTWGIFNGAHFVSRAHANKMLLHMPSAWPNDDAVLTFFPESVTMTSGIRTLLHEGDTLRVFRR